MGQPDTLRYLAAFSGAVRAPDGQIAVRSETTQHLQTLSPREWNVLQQAVGSPDPALVAIRASVALLTSPASTPSGGAEVAPVTPEEVVRLRDRFVRCELLIPISSTRTADDAATRPPRISVTTAGRAGALKRCLQRLTHDAARFGDDILITVHDNSSNPSDERRNHELCAALDRPAARVIHCGEPWRRQLARRLVGGGIAPPVVDFALRGVEHPRTGANRNAVLLAGAGAGILMLDDDILPCVRTPSDSQPGVTLAEAVDPRRFRFARTPAGLLDGLVVRPEPLWRSHAAVLGMSVRACVETQGLAGAPDGWIGPASSWGGLFRDGRIRATLHGIVGDSGMGWLRRWLMFEGASRDALVTYRQVYQAGCTTGLASRTTAGMQLAADGNGAVGGFGMDASELLPPFLPSYRSSDALFLALLKQMHQKSVVAFLPQTIEHWPLDNRTTSRGAIWACTGLRVSEIVVGVLAREPTSSSGATPAERLQAIGRVISDAAATGMSEFRLLIRDIWRAHLSAWLMATERALAVHHQQPAWWAADVVRFRERLRAEADQPGAELPRELDLRSADACQRLRHVLTMTGALYQAWPAIWQRAARGVDAETEAAVPRSRSSRSPSVASSR